MTHPNGSISSSLNFWPQYKGHDIYPDGNGDFLIFAVSEINNPKIINVNSNGEQIWAIDLEENNNCQTIKAVPSNDGCFYIATDMGEYIKVYKTSPEGETFYSCLNSELTICQPTLIGSGNDSYSYHWSTGDTTSTILASESGWLSVTITNDLGESINDSIHVNYLENDLMLNTLVEEPSIGNNDSNYRFEKRLI